jgi:hypothetical protein
MFFVREPQPSSGQAGGLSSLRADAPNEFRPVAFRRKHLCRDHDARAQPRVGKRAADDFFGATKTTGGCGIDQGDATFNGGADCLNRLLLVGAAIHPPIAQVPSPTRETLSGVPEIVANSISSLHGNWS